MPSVTTDRNHFAPRRHNYDDIIIIIVIDDIQRCSLICTSSQCFGREGGREKKRMSPLHLQQHFLSQWFTTKIRGFHGKQNIYGIYTYIFTVHVRPLTTQANSYCMFAWSRCLYCKTRSYCPEKPNTHKIKIERVERCQGSWPQPFRVIRLNNCHVLIKWVVWRGCPSRLCTPYSLADF